MAFPDESMWAALRRLGTRDVSRLPVVEGPGSRKLLGAVRRGDIVRAYNFAIVRRTRRQYRTPAQLADPLDSASFEHVDILADSPTIGRQLSEISLPESCLIVSIQREHELHVAHGDTVLQAGDRLIIFTNDDCMPLVRQQLLGQIE